MSLYENERQFWIVVVSLGSVDRPTGLAAYMSLLLRANDVVRAFRLSKVVEHWDITPGNGNAYYACACLHSPPLHPSPLDHPSLLQRHAGRRVGVVDSESPLHDDLLVL